MSFITTSRGWKTKVVAVVAAIAAVFGVMQLANTEKAAANQEILRPGCDWDLYQYWVQYCQVWSPSMNRNVAVHIKPAARGGNGGLYLLDGIHARDQYNNWIWGGNAPRVFEHDNVTLVAPTGGKSGFYTDWNRPAISAEFGVRIYKYETFLTQELPAYLEQHFGVSRFNNAVAGISMGASAALSLAANHRDQFRHASSFSGYLQLSNPVMATAVAASQVVNGGFDPTAMWGPAVPASPERIRNDPAKLLDQMQGLPMFLSSATGVPSNWMDPASLFADPATLPNVMTGATMEALSRASTIMFEGQARAAGLNPVVNYSPTGIHSWQLWEHDLNIAKPHMLAALGA